MKKETKEEVAAANYYSKDFEWEHLKQHIQTDPSLQHHLLPFQINSSVNGEEEKEDDNDAEAWDKFHSRHSTGKFFKERRYLLKEFPELASCEDFSKVLEVGCGNGSTVLPILRQKKHITIYACDCSHEALEKAKQNIDASDSYLANHHFHPFLCNFATSKFPTWLACDFCRDNFIRNQSIYPSDTRRTSSQDFNNLSSSVESGCCIGGVDFVTLIFTLSAVPTRRMPTAVAECLSVLKPGGLLLFRDYGLYDMTMLRFEPGQRVGDREYVRSDGTRSYFFSLDSARDLFAGAGFTELELEYCCVKSVNRRNGKVMQRVWVHGKFQRPSHHFS